MPNKSFREKEFLRKAREVLEEQQAAQAGGTAGAAVSPRQAAYEKAVKAFVTQADMAGTDFAKNKVGDVFAYAMQGGAQQQNVANSLLSNAGAKPARGDVKSWDWDTATRALLDTEATIKAMQQIGLYNTPEYAANRQYNHLTGTGYMRQLLENLNNQLTTSRKEDHNRSNWQYWSDMQNRLGGMNEYNAPSYWAGADYLLNEQTEPFSMDAYDAAWNNLTDDEYEAEMARLKAQFEGLDWDALTTQSVYTSKTPELEAQYAAISDEVKRRETIDALETLAKNNPEYAALSAYTYLGTVPEHVMMTSQGDMLKYGKSMEDPQAFVNVRASREVTDRAAMQNETVRQYRNKGYQYLTPDEISVYNVLYNTDQQKAQEYLDALQPTLYRRVATLEQMEQQTYATNGGWAAPMWLASIGAGLETAFMTPFQMLEAATGNDDPNAPMHYFNRAQQNIRGAQEEVLGELEAPELLGKNLYQWGYSGVSGAADNAARLMFGPQGSLAVAGLQSASGSLYENAGREDMEGSAKIVQALLTGGLEVGTEKIGLDALFDMGQGSALKYLAKAMGSELGEESVNYFGEYGLELAVAWLFGHEAEIRSAQELAKGYGETVLNTLISTGIMSGPGAVSTGASTRSAGKTAQQQGEVDTLLSIAEGMGEKTESAKWSAQLKEKKAKGKNLSNYDIGRLTMALEADVGEEMSAAPNKVMDEAIQERLQELGETEKSAKALAPAIRKTYRGQKLTLQERAAIRWDDNATQVVKELSRETSAADAQRTGNQWVTKAQVREVEAVAHQAEKAVMLNKAAGIGKAAAAETKTEGKTAQAAAVAVEKGKALAQNAADTLKGRKATAKAVAFEEAGATQSGEITRFIKEGNDLMVAVEQEEGGEKKVALDSLKATSDAGMGAIVAYVQDEGQQHHAMSEQEANTMMNVYAEVGGDAGAFIEGYEAAYLAGYAGLEAPANTGLDKNAAALAYQYGAANAQADETERASKAQLRGVQGTGAVTWLGKANSNADVKGVGTDIEEAMRGMTEGQRVTTEVVRALAEKMKIDVVLFESTEDNIQSMQNGSYQSGTNRIYIDVNAGAATWKGVQEQKSNHTLGYAMMKTLGHELTHYIEANSAEGYAAYKQAVKDALKNAGQDWATLVRGKLDNAIAGGYKLTLAGAEAEVVADASEYMLQNSEFVKSLDSDVKGKVKTFIQGFMQKVREIFSHISGSHRESRALRETIDGVMQYTGNLQQLWDASLQEATGQRTGGTVQETETDAAEVLAYEETTDEVGAEAENLEEQLAEEVYEEPAAAIEEERTMQEVIEKPTAQEIRQEVEATSQKAAPDFIKGLGQRFGLDIRVADRGQLLAAYDRSADTILIGENATTGEVLYKALAMEMFRSVEGSQYNTQLQNALYNAAYGSNFAAYAADKQAVADMLNRKFDNYGKRKLTAESALVQQELNARMAAKVLGNMDSLTALMESERPSLLRKIRNALRTFINKLRGIKTPALTPIERAAQLMAEALDERARTKGKRVTMPSGYGSHEQAVTMRQSIMAATTMMGEEVALRMDTATAGVPVEKLTPTTQFSMDRDVEIRKDGLMAVHNIKGPELESTLALGGFPMPSIAIIKAKEGHTMYGEYSVIFGKQTIDPKASVKNRVYGADAWTPVFPRTETEVLDDVMYEREQEAVQLASQVDEEYGKKARAWYSRFSGSDATTETMDDLQNSAWINDGMLAAYKADNGEKVQILEKDVEVSRGYNPARADMYNHLLDIVDLADLVDMKGRALIDKYSDQLAAEIPRPFARLNANWKQGDMQAGVLMLEIFKQATAYEGSGRDTSVKTEKAKDYYATADTMRSSTDREDFNKWVKGKLQDAFGMQGIYNGRERFTPAGNRRSFRQLHDEVTAANVVKAMASQEESNIPATDAAGLMAAASSMYKSIAEIKADAGRLGKISDEEYNARIAKANNAHHDLLNEIEAWDYTQIEDVGQLLVQAAKKRMDAASIAALMKRNGYKATQKAGKMAADLIHQVQTIPSGYFEAKPARVVGFDEIKMIIAPDSMPSELAAKLDKLGIPYTTYDGTDADRLAKSNAVEGVQFSTRAEDQLDEDKYYKTLIDKWDGTATGGRFKVGTIKKNSIYERIGLPAADLYFDHSKAAKALIKHGDHVTKETLKMIPEILANPVVITEPMKQQLKNTISVYGEMTTENGTPIMVGIMMRPDRTGTALLNVVRTVELRRDARSLINNDSVLYISGNKKRTADWFQGLGIQVPFAGTKSGFIRSISYEAENVNSENQVQYSPRDLPDTVSIRDYLGAMETSERMTETEIELLGRYQMKLENLRAKEQEVAEQAEIIRTAPVNSEELTKAKNREKILRTQANRIARELSRMERAEGFAGIMATGQEVVNKYLTGTSGSIADATDALETEIKGLTDRLKVISATVEGTAEGQRNAVARGLFDPTTLNKAAKELRDSYASRMSAKQIADRLALAFGELYANEGAVGAQKFAAEAKELAQDILNSSRYRYRSERLTAIAEEIPVIGLTETDKAEIRSAGLTMTEYKRMLSPYVKVAEGATDLSSYVSSAEAYGGMANKILGDDVEGNLAMALYNTIQAERASESVGTLEGMNESESLGTVMADIVSINLPATQSSATLEYLRKELKKYAGESEETSKAIDKAIQSAKAATGKASSVWREAVKAQDVARKAVEYYRALEEQRRLIELQEQKQAITEQLKSDAAKKIAEQVEAKRQEYRERERKAREYRKTRDEVEKLRRSIGRKVKRLNTLRVRETDQKHVPQELQHMADEVMQVFTDSGLSRLAFSKEKTASLAHRYRALRELESDTTYYWDDEIEATLNDLQALSEQYTALTTKADGTPARYYTLEGVELETEILQGVDNIVSNVMQMIDSANEAFNTKRNETFSQYANQTGEDLMRHKDYKVLRGKAGDAQMALDAWMRTGNMTPVYFFDQLRNGRIKDVFNEIRDGQTKYAKIIREGQELVQSAKEKYHYSRWAGDASLKMKTSQGHEITLTREQAMWVYATAKREQASQLYKTEHLIAGGFQYKDTSLTGQGLFRQKDTPHLLDTADVAKISEWLTEEQRAYADEMVGYLSTEMAEHGNEASMKMYGYKKFLESYYFPFKTKAEQRFLKGDEGAGGEDAGTGRIRNAGFTKKVQHKANATLVMDDFTTVVADHMQSMATYAGMVQPIENLKRLLNHKVIDRDGTVNTIRALLGQKYGKATQDYMTQFLKDLNGAVQGDARATKGVDFLVNAFKRGAVLASASVVLQQPTAVARAMAYINPKYFAQNPFYRPGKGTWDEMLKYSGTAVIKDMGKFDVGMGMTASQYITDEHLNMFEAYRRLKNQSTTKAGAEAYKRFMDWLTAAPGKADQWTWGVIWKATKAEVAAQNPGMDTGSEAFLRKVGARFDEVIDYTQVYDSVLTRSNLMRSKNAFHKTATSFMSEPTLSLNMLYDAVWGKHSGKQRAAIIGGVVASQVLAGAMAALVQAWNDDEDKRNYLEKYTDRAVGNIFDNLNPLGMIPYISDIMSLFEGYDVERPDMTVITDLLDYSTKFVKSFEDGEGPTWKEVENFAGSWANLFGIPFKNISRELRRTRNAIWNTDWSEPNMTNVGFVALENVNILGIGVWGGEKRDYYERMITAMQNGDNALVEDYRTYLTDSKAVEPDKLTEGLRDVYKEHYQAGGIANKDAITFMVKNGLAKDQKSAFEYVDKWTEGGKDHSAYTSIRLYIGKNDMAAVDKEIAELLANGWTAEQVYNALISDVNEHYLNSKMTHDQYKAWYDKHGIAAGKEARDDNAWYWHFKELDWGRANGGSTEGWGKYNDFFAAVESGTDLRKVIREYTSHGVEAGTLASKITNQYKQQLIDLYRNGKRKEAANLQARLLTAYEALGYDRARKQKDIQTWLK